MKPIEVAQAKSERLFEELFAMLQTEAAHASGQANLRGMLLSSGLGCQIRTFCITKLETLKSSMIRFYVDALGHRLDQAATKNAISDKMGEFFEKCKITFFGPNCKRSANEQNVAEFEKETGHLLHQLDHDLQIAVHEAKRSAPSFWKDKKHDILLALISGIIGGIVGIIGTLVTLWLTKALKLGTP